MNFISRNDISLTTGYYQGIQIREVWDDIHREIMNKHIERMKGQTVIVISNLPEWFSVNDAFMHPPNSDLTVVQYFTRLQEDGSIGSWTTALFEDVVQGNTSTSIVLAGKEQNIQKALPKMELIKSIFMDMIGENAAIEVTVWPEDTVEEEHSTESSLISQSAAQGVSDLRAEIKHITKGISELKEVAQTLLEIKTGMTAPLTSVVSPEGTTVSSLSDLVEKAVHDGMEKAQSEGGILYEQEQDLMTRMGHVILEELVTTVRESVRQAVEEGTILSQETVQKTLEDHNRAMLRMITAPSRTYAGEIAATTMEMLKPILEALSTGMTRIAALVETATFSHEYSALGSVAHGVTSTSITLNEIKHALRSVNCQVSKGYDMFQAMIKELRTALASEVRRETEKEVRVRTYLREMGVMRQLYVQQIPDMPESPQLRAMQNYIEATNKVQMMFQEHFNQYGGTEYWQTRRDQEHTSEEEVQDDVIEEEDQQTEDMCRKDPPEHLEEVLYAHCEPMMYEDKEEDNDNTTIAQVEEAQVAMAMARSLDLYDHDSKPPALSDEELERRRRLAEEQRSLEDELRHKDMEQWNKDAIELGLNPISETQQDKHKEQAEDIVLPDDEEVQGTPPPSKGNSTNSNTQGS